MYIKVPATFKSENNNKILSYKDIDFTGFDIFGEDSVNLNKNTPIFSDLKYILNTTQNGQNISSHTSITGYGENSTSGLRGYQIGYINVDTNEIKLSSVDGLEVGMVFSTSYTANLPSHVDTVITDINHAHDIITVSKVRDDGEYHNDDYLFIIGRPDLGDTDIGIGSHVEGFNNKALFSSHAEGGETIAEGRYSHTEGFKSKTRAHYSHAEGYYTLAYGRASHVEGATYTDQNTGIVHTNISQGDGSHAEGQGTKAIGNASHSEGRMTIAEGQLSHAEGKETIARDTASHAEGVETQALGRSSHAEGCRTKSTGTYAHAEGMETTASGDYTHSEGYQTFASFEFAHTEGSGSRASGSASHAEGKLTQATGEYSHAEGFGTIASGVGSHSEGAGYDGEDSRASGKASHVEGQGSFAGGEASHAEGRLTQAKGALSHTEGNATETSSEASHAEGKSTKALNVAAHAEGQGTQATGMSSHAEGTGSKATATAAHAEGSWTNATGVYSHAEGASTYATGKNSHAEGNGTYANGDDQHVQGRFNSTNANLAHIVGNGTSASDRKNMHTLDWYGNAWYSSTIRVGGASYAEGKPLATTEYVDNHISTKIDIISHDVEVLKRAAYENIYTMITTATEENPVLVNDGVMLAANISSIGPGIVYEVSNFAPISEYSYSSSAAVILDANNGIIKIPAGDYNGGDIAVEMIFPEPLAEGANYFFGAEILSGEYTMSEEEPLSIVDGNNISKVGKPQWVTAGWERNQMEIVLCHPSITLHCTTDVILKIYCGSSTKFSGTPVVAVKHNNNIVYNVPEHIINLRATLIDEQGTQRADCVIHGIVHVTNNGEKLYNSLDLDNKRYVIRCGETNGETFKTQNETFIDLSEYISDTDGEILVSTGDTVTFVGSDLSSFSEVTPNEITYIVKRSI